MDVKQMTDQAGIKFPADGTSDQKLSCAVKCACMTLPMAERHVSQFRLEEDHVELHATHPRESLDEADDRTEIIRSGVLLHNLKLALKHFGCLGQVELFPDIARPYLMARIHHGAGSAGQHEAGFFEAMTGRKSMSANFPEMPANESVVEMLQSGPPGDKAWLEFSQSDSSRGRLVSIVKGNSRPVPANGLDQAEPGKTWSKGWTRPLLTFIVKADSSHNFTVQAGVQRVDEMAALAIVKTKTDDKHGWLATGQVAARARLQATALGISSHVFNQAFGDRRIREELRTDLGRKGFAQAVIGFGRRAVTGAVQPSAVASSHERNSSIWRRA